MRAAPNAARATALAALAAAIIGLAAGCGGGGSSGSSATSTTAGGCQQVAQPKPRNVSLKPPPKPRAASLPHTAVVKTNCGTFQIALDVKQSPKTVNSFAYLVSHRFYNGLSFHRVVPNFVIQGGDPKGNGLGGPGYTVVERPPPNTSYLRGVVAMAKSAQQPPGASGSQFFVVTAPADAGLSPDYAVLGKVTKGMAAVQRIAKLGNPALGTTGGKPIEPVVIDSITTH
jgi:cyclophilin family peptidyl-prolyl cis-trans isomerase